MRSHSTLGLVVLACAMSAAIVWIASQRIFGVDEPWDDEGSRYELALFIIGLVGAAFVPARHLWLPCVAVWLGQSLGFLWAVFAAPHDAGPLAALGFFIFLPMSSFASLVGACIGAPIGVLIRALYRRHRNAGLDQ
jgi:hypothetical protein